MRIEVPLSHGLKLVAESSTDSSYPRELYVGIADSDDVWLQDLAVVMNSYTYDLAGQMEYIDNKFKVLVYGDETVDDFTDEVHIKLREDV